jgi:hypothetical protein
MICIAERYLGCRKGYFHKRNLSQIILYFQRDTNTQFFDLALLKEMALCRGRLHVKL